jgi:hypothetical protein
MGVSIATEHGFDGGGAGSDGQWQHYGLARPVVVLGERLLSLIKHL